LSHWRTPNDVIRVIPDTLRTTVLPVPRSPNPMNRSSTRPEMLTSVASPLAVMSTVAAARAADGGGGIEGEFRAIDPTLPGDQARARAGARAGMVDTEGIPRVRHSDCGLAG
jgi:hypothetical protein